MQKQTGKKRSKGVWIALIVLVLIGIVGGFGIKLIFYDAVGDGTMPNREANRLISYLGIGEYEYTDRLGSSFTVKDMRKLLDAAGVDYGKTDVPLAHTPGFIPLTKKQFESVYSVLIQELQLDRVRSTSLYIYDINPENDKEIEGIAYEVVNTSDGDYYMEKDYGLDHSYIGRVVRLYVSNNEIILCLGESEDTIRIQNVYLSKIGEEDGTQQVFAYVDGAMHKFAWKKNKDVDTSKKGYLADLTLTNDGVTGVEDHSSKLVEAKVTAYEDGTLTVEGYKDPLMLSESFNVYKTKGSFRAMRSAGNLLGYDKVSLYIQEDTVEAALITEDIYAKNIRVLISPDNGNGYYHDAVTITSDTAFTISYGKTQQDYAAGETVQFRNGSPELADGAAKITSKEEDGRITIQSINRQSGAPSYRGTIELSRDDKGVLVINELPVEEYLYGVVPSEMPVTYEEEALKAQAICARAYAYRQMESETYSEYGAHLDDTIACQVYNNVNEDARSTYAVDDTYGVVPCYNDEVIEAFFFSTSCGSTSNNSEVWGGIQEPYLLDTMETELNDFANLDNEVSFRDFMDGKVGTGFIEQDEPFFRWTVGFTKQKLSEAINSHLYERIQAMPEDILAQNAQGEYVKKDIQSIGDVVSIEVTKRGSSGIILEMVIHGTAETILVKGQTNARALLNPENVSIRKQDGSTLNGWTSLPSAYFYIDDSNGFVIRGGGFGHGVGMSQNGANDMAKLGYKAKDIIAHYYTSVELKDMYQLSGK